MAGLLTNLWRLIGPTLPNGFCPQSFQDLADALFNGAQVTFLIDSGNFLYNYGTATPTPENRIFPWLNTDDNLWYTFQLGLWVSPVNPADLQADFNKLWIPVAGTPESDLWSKDRGDGTDPRVLLPDGSPNPSYSAPTATTGAMWMVEHRMDGLFPLGAGAIPNSAATVGGPNATAQVGQSTDSNGGTGEYKHLLTEPEGAVGAHIHPFGLTNLGGGPHADDAFFANLGLNAVSPFSGYYVTGSGSVVVATETQANLYTLPSGLDGKGVLPSGTTPQNTAVGHNNMCPYMAVFFIKHTSRKFYTRPR